MYHKEIFRKQTLDKLRGPEDLEALLQVNSSRSWLLLGVVLVLLAAVLVWGFMGSVSRRVGGPGILLTLDLPRVIVASCPGQVDSISCRSGQMVEKDQVLMTIVRPEDAGQVRLKAGCPGEIIGISAREGDYVTAGQEVGEMVRLPAGKHSRAEAVFFVDREVLQQIRIGMKTDLDVEIERMKQESFSGTISFISNNPASRMVVSKYLPESRGMPGPAGKDLFEVRARLNLELPPDTAAAQVLLQQLNGLACRASVTVGRRSPVAYLFQ